MPSQGRALMILRSGTTASHPTATKPRVATHLGARSGEAAIAAPISAMLQATTRLQRRQPPSRAWKAIGVKVAAMNSWIIATSQRDRKWRTLASQRGTGYSELTAYRPTRHTPNTATETCRCVGAVDTLRISRYRP